MRVRGSPRASNASIDGEYPAADVLHTLGLPIRQCHLQRHVVQPVNDVGTGIGFTNNGSRSGISHIVSDDLGAYHDAVPIRKHHPYTRRALPHKRVTQAKQSQPAGLQAGCNMKLRSAPSMHVWEGRDCHKILAKDKAGDYCNSDPDLRESRSVRSCCPGSSPASWRAGPGRP
jgi:hypothetical protein